MRPVEIYTTPICPYCHAAKRLLDRKGAAYREIDVSRDLETAMAFQVMATPTTVVVQGGKVQEVLLGVVPRAKLEALLA